MKEPVFLSREAIDFIHQVSLKEFGGADGVRDETALESALAQPLHEFHYAQADLFQVAAAYAFHIAQNQPFVDGNKRTGLLAALNFLAVNGVFAAATSEKYYDIMIEIAERRLDKVGLAAVLRSLLS